MVECVPKVVSYAGRLFKMHIEISCWCAQQCFLFFSPQCCSVSVPHDMFQKWVWRRSHSSASVCLYPNLTALCFLACGNSSQTVQSVNCWIIWRMFHEAISDCEPYVCIGTHCSSAAVSCPASWCSVYFTLLISIGAPSQQAFIH